MSSRKAGCESGVIYNAGNEEVVTAEAGEGL